MTQSLHVRYELPFLDIIAVLIAFIALTISLFGLSLNNENRKNTGDTVTELQLTREVLLDMKEFTKDLTEIKNDLKIIINKI